MSPQNLTFRLKGIKELFESQVLPLVANLYYRPEGEETFRRLVMSEAIDLITSNEYTRVKVMAEYKVPENIFEHYLSDQGKEIIFGLDNNVLKGLICVMAMEITSNLTYVNMLHTYTTAYYRSSLSWEYLVVGIEVFDQNQIRATVDHLNANIIGEHVNVNNNFG